MDILTLLKKEGRPLMPAEAAKILKKTPAGVRSQFCRLSKAGIITRVPGGYIPADAAQDEDDFSWIDAGPRQRSNDNDTSIYDRNSLRNVRQRCPGNGEGNVFRNGQATYSGNGEATDEGNEATEEDNAYAPEEAFSTGYTDATGERPDSALVRREVRRVLAEKGLPFDAEQVDREIANFLYLRGQRAGEVEIGRRTEEKNPPNVRERIHAFCESARNYLLERGTQPEFFKQQEQERGEMQKRQRELIQRVARWLKTGGEVKAYYELVHLAWADEIASEDVDVWLALGREYLRQNGKMGVNPARTFGDFSAGIVEQNTRLVKEAIAKPANPAITVFDAILRAKLAAMLVDQLTPLLPETAPAEVTPGRSLEEIVRIDRRVKEILRE
ncbi:MAG: hypothetical protein AB1523_08265 [Bacillota bacterium]